jgi:hypothetical protein
LVAINCLFLHTHTCVHELEWERFQAEYQVFDAVFALARDTHAISRTGVVSHGARLEHLCSEFGIPFDAPKARSMVTLRNDLLHEALWDGRMPGEARSMESAYASYWLHSLSRRALFACLGLRGGYAETAWWGMGTFAFNLPT